MCDYAKLGLENLLKSYKIDLNDILRSFAPERNGFSLNKQFWKKVFSDTLPVLSGYMVLGIGFGMVLRAAGYGLPFALAMSILIFAGSMQYVAVGLISGGASLITVALTTLLVNCRHLFYGISMVDRYRSTGARKPYLIFALTDETYSLVCREPEGLAPEQYNNYYLAVSLLDQCYWVTGSVLGSLFGSMLSISMEGIDFTLTALFLTIVTDQWLKEKRHFPAIAGAAATLICRIIFGSGSFLIPSMLAITALLLADRRFGKEAKL